MLSKMKEEVLTRTTLNVGFFEWKGNKSCVMMKKRNTQVLCVFETRWKREIHKNWVMITKCSITKLMRREIEYNLYLTLSCKATPSWSMGNQTG